MDFEIIEYVLEPGFDLLKRSQRIISIAVIRFFLGLADIFMKATFPILFFFDLIRVFLRYPADFTRLLRRRGYIGGMLLLFEDLINLFCH